MELLRNFMTKQKQHKNIRITKEKNMYKIIKNNTSTMASYESKKEAYNAILSILFEITKNLPANSIEMINAKNRLDFLIDGKLFAFYQIIEFDANADEMIKILTVAGMKNVGMTRIWRMHYCITKSRLQKIR